ncbi:hypothetical protein MA16_Dca001610 [Dendrobium catenatum]|uniref:Uncharacterized protein n=1 Tax=Dendrobium catenatum TaxID=906689 RepID=A0A2I0WMW6_9ASPA|nr:hypothetical protein MA16_Dca001610 [Dendrobium catenatum]
MAGLRSNFPLRLQQILSAGRPVSPALKLESEPLKFSVLFIYHVKTDLEIWRDISDAYACNCGTSRSFIRIQCLLIELRSPPPNGGRGGGMKENWQHYNYWHQIDPDDEAVTTTSKHTPVLKPESSSQPSPKVRDTITWDSWNEVVAKAQAIIRGGWCKEEGSKPVHQPSPQGPTNYDNRPDGSIKTPSSASSRSQGANAQPEQPPGITQQDATDQPDKSSLLLASVTSSECRLRGETDNSEDEMEFAGDSDSNTEMEDD